MAEIRKSSWAKEIKYDNGLVITIASLKKNVVDLVSITAGAYIMYSCGKLVGEGIDNIPHLNEWIPQAVNYVSGIDIKDNIDGLTGLLCGAYGASKSGTTLSNKNLELRSIAIAPFDINYGSKK